MRQHVEQILPLAMEMKQSQPPQYRLFARLQVGKAIHRKQLLCDLWNSNRCPRMEMLESPNWAFRVHGVVKFLSGERQGSVRRNLGETAWSAMLMHETLLLNSEKGFIGTSLS